jgi:hypothetical protein
LLAAVPQILAQKVAYKATSDQEASLSPTSTNFQTQVVRLEVTFSAVLLHLRSGGEYPRNKHFPIFADEYRCCKSNPCANTPASTCEGGDLVPAFMGRPEQFNAYAPSSLPSPSSASSSGSNNGAVIGGVVGGGLGAAIIIGVIIFFFCRRKKRTQQLAHHETGANASTAMMKEGFEKRYSVQYGGQSRKFTLEYTVALSLTINEHRQHILRPTRMSISLCLLRKISHIMERTRHIGTKLANLKNYQQIPHRLQSIDTLSSQQKDHLVTLKECQNFHLIRFKWQRSSNHRRLHRG